MSLNTKTKNRYILLFVLTVLILCCIAVDIFSSSHLQGQQYGSNNHNYSDKNVKVFTPDWGVAATLTNLGYPPFAVGEKKGYGFRVENPPLPEAVIDVGYRGQPNPELVAQMDLDVIINSINYKEATTAYPKDIPLVFTDFGNRNLPFNEVPEWQRFTPYIHDISKAIDQPEIAEPYIKQSYERIIEAGENIRKHLGDNRKVVVANFWDMRQLSVYNTNSNVNTTVHLMGLELLSIGEPSKWGSSYIYPDKLYDLPEDTCLIVVEPLIDFTKYDNVTSPIWQRSPFFAPDACLYVIDPVWTNNGIEGMVTFANNLEAAVTQPTDIQLMNKGIGYDAVIRHDVYQLKVNKDDN